MPASVFQTLKVTVGALRGGGGPWRVAEDGATGDVEKVMPDVLP